MEYSTASMADNTCFPVPPGLAWKRRTKRMTKVPCNRRSAPYVPSYMNLTTGPEPCMVCGDAATGYHYRCMTCEGCKGFFRRTTQKNLKYICKGSGNCLIAKATRNHCPQCRYQKCIREGMAVDLVLNECQRMARRQLIEENRERRKMDNVHNKLMLEAVESRMTDKDRISIRELVDGYMQVLAPHPQFSYQPMFHGGWLRNNRGALDNHDLLRLGHDGQIADIMTPAVTRLVHFSQKIPGFTMLMHVDQILLLKAACLEIMILRTALRYDRISASLPFKNGVLLNQYYFACGWDQNDTLLRPLFSLALGLAEVYLDEPEVAVMMGLLLVSDRPGLTAAGEVGRLEQTLFGALRRYISEKLPMDVNRFGLIVIKIVELRTICLQNTERIMRMKLDGMGDGLSMLLETMFDFPLAA